MKFFVPFKSLFLLNSTEQCVNMLKYFSSILECILIPRKSEIQLTSLALSQTFKIQGFSILIDKNHEKIFLFFILNTFSCAKYYSPLKPFFFFEKKAYRNQWSGVRMRSRNKRTRHSYEHDLFCKHFQEERFIWANTKSKWEGEGCRFLYLPSSSF